MISLKTRIHFMRNFDDRVRYSICALDFFSSSQLKNFGKLLWGKSGNRCVHEEFSLSSSYSVSTQRPRRRRKAEKTAMLNILCCVVNVLAIFSLVFGDEKKMTIDRNLVGTIRQRRTIVNEH